MKGGFKSIETKRSKSKNVATNNFNQFAINLLSEGIVNNLSAASKDISKVATQTHGGAFAEDFTSWIKMRADPYHDFKRDHPYFNLQNALLLRTYENILETETKSMEDSVLLSLLQDINAPHGISIKYMRFYKKQKDGPKRSGTASAAAAASTSNAAFDAPEDEEMTAIDEVWANVENEFNNLPAAAAATNAHRKFYLLNSPITGLSKQFSPTDYVRITPLPVLWDSIASKLTVDFSIKDKDAADAFYDAVYTRVHRELYNATGIGLLVHEAADRTVELEVFTPPPTIRKATFKLKNKGFSIPIIKHAIAAMSSGDGTITFDGKTAEIEPIMRFLHEAGVPPQHIISFILVCKMSGDAGQVEFIRQISSYKGAVVLHGKRASAETVIHLNGGRELFFLYTGDRLCAANAIVNDVKCVFGYSGYVAQFLGHESSFNVSVFLEAYFAVLEDALALVGRKNAHALAALLGASDDQKFAKIVELYYDLFAATFDYSATAIAIHKSAMPASGSVDDFVRYVIAISGLIDIYYNFDKILKGVVAKAKIAKRAKKWTAVTTRELLTSGTYDPLIHFFVSILIIPETEVELKQRLFVHLSDRMLKRAKIIIDSYAAAAPGYTQFNVLRER